VATGGITGKRRIVPGCITLCGPEPIRWLGGSGSGAGEFIEITASAAFRRELAKELHVPEHADLDDIYGWSDPIVWAIAARFRSAARDTISINDLERDLLLRRLYARVLEVRFGARASARGNGGLDNARLRRVLDFIEAHLEEHLTIGRLAEVAALSPFHFLRAFRRSSGLTPHRYVRGRRLERARHLLASSASARTVARRVGYDSLSHFRAAYRAHFGATYDQDPRLRRRQQVAAGAADIVPGENHGEQ
jgi:AraC family transcriptional regulator